MLSVITGDGFRSIMLEPRWETLVPKRRGIAGALLASPEASDRSQTTGTPVKTSAAIILY
jgi:hypothetical protein